MVRPVSRDWRKAIFVWFITAPRWFALPVAVAGIVLGGILTDAPALLLFLAVLAGSLLMAASHLANAWLDWSVTKFDQGPPDERSHKKPYTSGQNFIAEGILSPRWTLACWVFWLLAATIPMIFLSLMSSPWVWLPYAVVIGCSVWYSFAKKWWHPEIPLGLGFGPMAVMLGAAAGPEPDLGQAFLAGLVFAWTFGYCAEFVDQAVDADVNWKKGLRNLGALAWETAVPKHLFLGLLILAGYILQLGLVDAGVLSHGTLLTFAVLPLIFYGLLLLGDEFRAKGLWLLMAALGLHTVFLVIGESVW